MQAPLLDVGQAGLVFTGASRELTCPLLPVDTCVLLQPALLN